MKKSFIMYTSWMPMVSNLPDEQAGQLFKAVAAYQTGEDFTFSEPVVAAVFEMFKATFSEDEEKYEEICRQRSEAGKQGGRPKKADGSSDNPEKANAFDEKQKKANAFSEKQTEAKKAEYEYENDIDLKDIKKHSPEEPDSVEIAEVISHLNQKTGAHYKPDTDKTKRLIRARLREGFTLENFKTVIDKMAGEWMGTDMEKYLRPETLFGTKFESYLNRSGRASPKPVPVNGFTNFEQRVYDYDELERRLTGVY